jgi:hypothetical protein
VVQAITALLGPPPQQAAPASASVAPITPLPQPPPSVSDTTPHALSTASR